MFVRKRYWYNRMWYESYIDAVWTRDNHPCTRAASQGSTPGTLVSTVVSESSLELDVGRIYNIVYNTLYTT